jgi:hypothetical protein
VSPVKYELGFYNPEDDILHSHRRGNLKCYNVFESLTISSKSPEGNRSRFLLPSVIFASTRARLRRYILVSRGTLLAHKVAAPV